MPDHDHIVRKALLEFLHGGNAHADLEDAIKNLPASQYAARPDGAPHTAWQLLEHIRITLHDLLEFCRNSEYSPPKWPDDYWPAKDAPESEQAWKTSVLALKKEQKELVSLVHDPGVDIYARIPWGDGQTILREILLAGDHTSYHVGQLVMLRKQLGSWKK